MLASAGRSRVDRPKAVGGTTWPFSGDLRAGYSSLVLVRLLGPVDVVVDSVVRPVSGLRRKAVLAVLGLAAGEVVDTDHLLDVVWDGQPSTVGVNALQTHVSYLRRVLGSPAAIVARGSGYLLDLDGDATDVQVAVGLIEEGRRESRPQRRAARLRAALDLWRGQPLSDVTGLRWLDAQAEWLHAVQLDARLALTEARLELGEHAVLAAELTDLSRQHPYREDLCRQVMLALYRTGRQAEALAAYQDLRHRLVDELGIEPGTALRDLEVAILRQDPAIDLPASSASDGFSGRTDGPTGQIAVRRVDTSAFPLPPDTGVFTGRTRESEEIVVAAQAAVGPGQAMSVHAIHGMPGVGKTALAVHVAHRLVQRLAVRTMFVNLHGYTAGRAPADPADVLAALLTSDGIDPRHVPGGTEARSALWRQRTAHRPVLLVLDNAASSGQVMPLLPDAPGSVVLVTSRRFLGDLPVDAITVPLDVLAPADAGQLFLRLASPAVVDPDGVAELVALCGHLPLAVALLARLQVRHRSWAVGDLLVEARARLVTVTVEDRTVEAAFDLSYQNLAVDRQRLFRCLGLHPGVEIDGHAAAALAGVPKHEAIGHLDALHADNLLVEVGYRRYSMHDLIRSYARRLAATDPAGARGQALDRLVGYYRYVAAAADARLARHARPIVGADPVPATGVPDVADATRALAWMRAERDNLLACIAASTDPRDVVALTATVAELLRRDGPWTDAVAAHQAAAAAAEQVGDRLGRATALTELATSHRMVGNHQVARQVGEQALEIFRDLGNRLGEANALNCLGNIWRIDGDYEIARQALEDALLIYRELGDSTGRATALTYLGTVRYALDEYPAAAQALRDAVSLCRDVGDRLGVAVALTFLGEVLRVDGDYPGAVDTLHEALTGHRDLGDRLGEANTLTFLGNVHTQTGNYQEAAQYLKEALDLFRDLGDRRGQANALDTLGQARLGTGNHPGAMQAAQESLDLYRELGSRPGQGNALLHLGRIKLSSGDHLAARQVMQQALDVYRELGDRSSESETLSDLGALLRLTGDLDEARNHHLQAVKLAQQINSHWDEAYAWAALGRCDLASADIPAAVTNLSKALAIFQRIGAAEAAEVAAELDAVGV
jgi:DNA-binding SARP family transcriptional activator/tetratricopeptide (TPR) repeat protein